MSPDHAIICLKHYLDGKDFPITYAKRKNYIYIYRTDCTTASIDEAIEGKYLEKRFDYEKVLSAYSNRHAQRY